MGRGIKGTAGTYKTGGKVKDGRQAPVVELAAHSFLLRVVMTRSGTNNKYYNMIISPLFIDVQSFSIQEIISLACFFPTLTLLCTILLRICLYPFTLERM